MSILIDRFDHVVINCNDVEKTAEWYRTVLGMTVENFGVDNRTALKFGRQKINLRPIGAQNWETGRTEAAGSEDLCFITEMSPENVVQHFAECGVTITAGPVQKTGALGPMTSVYCRDPDGNLIEVASYPSA